MSYARIGFTKNKLIIFLQCCCYLLRIYRPTSHNKTSKPKRTTDEYVRCTIVIRYYKVVIVRNDNGKGDYRVCSKILYREKGGIVVGELFM